MRGGAYLALGWIGLCAQVHAQTVDQPKSQTMDQKVQSEAAHSNCLRRCQQMSCANPMMYCTCIKQHDQTFAPTCIIKRRVAYG